MNDSTKKRSVSKKRAINPTEKDKIVKQKLAEFYKGELQKEASLNKLFSADAAVLLGAGCFGHVFLISAKRDVTYEDLQNLTVTMGKDQKHETLNRVEPLKVTNLNEVALKKNSNVAIKCEAGHDFQVEHFPINQRTLPDADITRYAIYKEYNTLNAIYTRYGHHETRGFTRPYAFGKLGDLHHTVVVNNRKIKMFSFHFLLFEICGPDMEEMMDFCCNNCRQNEQRLSTRTVFMIGDQLLSRLQSIQEPSLGLAHNDLKGDQLMPGKGENANTIYLIDYGLVSNIKETFTLVDPLIIGNRRWAPRSNHQNRPKTLLCEIESACYVLLRLLKNSFPWDGMFDRQNAHVKEMKERGEREDNVKQADEVVAEEKQYLWYYLKRESGKKHIAISDDAEHEIEKYKEFFEERNDKWGDGGAQMKEMMIDLAKMGDPLHANFHERLIEYEDINYVGIRKHLLNIFDLSMYSHSLDSAGLSGLMRVQVENFFRENRERKEQRTECGRPVYYYFPEGEQHCYWEWYCRVRDLGENRPEYWHKVLANREQLLELLCKRQQSSHKRAASPKK